MILLNVALIYSRQHNITCNFRECENESQMFHQGINAACFSCWLFQSTLYDDRHFELLLLEKINYYFKHAWFVFPNVLAFTYRSILPFKFQYVQYCATKHVSIFCRVSFFYVVSTEQRSIDTKSFSRSLKSHSSSKWRLFSYQLRINIEITVFKPCLN